MAWFKFETTQPTLNPESVMQALNQIKTSTQDLNGVENLNHSGFNVG
jgi:hypothetical protein